MGPAVEDNIREVNRIFEEELVRNRNVSALDRVYTADARLLPPGGDMVRGRENIKEFWRGALEALQVGAVRLETVELQRQGDTAYEIGKATLEFAGGGSST